MPNFDFKGYTPKAKKLLRVSLCNVQFQKKSIVPPMEGQWKFLGGGGVKSQNFRTKV